MPNLRIPWPNPGIRSPSRFLHCLPSTVRTAPCLLDTSMTGDIAMHATYRSRPALGTTTAPTAGTHTRKLDRLDLLARTIRLSDRSVTMALSGQNGSDRSRSTWNELFDQAENLGRQWADTDPIDAQRLQLSLLASLPVIAERFERGYAEMACAHSQSVDGYPARRDKVHTSIPSSGMCDACDTNVSILWDDLAADQSIVACPCCGQHWDP
ncbi:hypothetical protein DYST_02668 [Dyella terrae]|nr:hypothetical protein DYST_02668 [Dyella terrae]